MTILGSLIGQFKCRAIFYAKISLQDWAPDSAQVNGSDCSNAPCLGLTVKTCLNIRTWVPLGLYLREKSKMIDLCPY